MLARSNLKLSEVCGVLCGVQRVGDAVTVDVAPASTPTRSGRRVLVAPPSHVSWREVIVSEKSVSACDLFLGGSSSPSSRTAST